MPWRWAWICPRFLPVWWQQHFSGSSLPLCSIASSFNNSVYVSQNWGDQLMEFCDAMTCFYRFFPREAASNFLTALSLQRKSQSRQQSHQVMSGNIWAALRIALSMMDQPELFQAANIGDLDHLMRAFNLDIWRPGGSNANICPLFTYYLISTQQPKVQSAQSEWTDGRQRQQCIFMHVQINYSRQSYYIFHPSTSEQFWGQVLPRVWRDCSVLDLHCNLWFPWRAQGRAKIVRAMP